MLNFETLKKAIASISHTVDSNKNYLMDLDRQNGDGDLGISMTEGFRAVHHMLESTDERDLGKVFRQCSRTFNEAAPSSLGTILSIGMMGIAKSLKGKTEASAEEFADACENGIAGIREKAGSKEGEKTILDAVCPAVRALKEHAGDGEQKAWEAAAKAAAEGSEKTKDMKAVHGRAAYYGEQSIGLIDGGSVVGKLIFEGVVSSLEQAG